MAATSSFNTKSFAVVGIDNVEQLVTVPVGQLIMHEVHRPGFIDRLRYSQGLWLLPDQPFFGLNKHIKRQFTINSINALMVPAEAFHIAQIQKA